MTAFFLILLALLLVGVSFTMTAAESAFTYLPRHDAEKLSSQDEQHAALRAVLEDPRTHMHALRLVRVGCEALVVVLLTLAFTDLAHLTWVGGALAVVVASALLFVVAGVTPRHVGRTHPITVVSWTAPLLRATRTVLGPVPGWLMSLGSAGGGHEEESAGFFTEEELREFVDRASTTDQIEDSEAAMMHSIFELDDTRIRGVMVPRTDTVTLDSTEGLDQAMALFLRSGYSRIPVLGEDFDDVRGFLYLKDAAAALLPRGEDAERRTVTELMRPAQFVPESQRVSGLLSQMQREGIHIAVVVDEYGGTAGLVTLEDLIEELVGEIVDEYDASIPEVVEESGGYLVSARMGAGELGEIMDRDLDDDEVDTVGGLLAKALGRVPIVGSEAEIYGVRLKAVKLEGRRNRVSTVLAWADPEASADES